MMVSCENKEPGTSNNATHFSTSLVYNRDVNSFLIFFSRVTASNSSESPGLDMSVARVENGEASILPSLLAELLTGDLLGIREMLGSVNGIGIKSPWVGVDVWLLLSLSWLTLEVHDHLIVFTVVGVTLWPWFLPVGFLVLHEVVLIDSTNELVVVAVSVLLMELLVMVSVGIGSGSNHSDDNKG